MLVAALIPVMWFVQGNDFPRVDAFLRDAFQHLNSTSNINHSIVTININKEKEVFSRPLTFESILPVLEKIFKSNPKKVIVLLSPRELQHDYDQPKSMKQKLFDYLATKDNAYIYAASDATEDDVFEDKLLSKFPRIFSFQMLPDQRWGPRDSKRRRTMIWYDKQGYASEFDYLRELGLTTKDPEYFKYTWHFWGSKQAYIKTFPVGTFGSHDASNFLESNSSAIDLKDKYVILGTNDEYSFITQLSVLDLSDKIAETGFKGYPPSDSLANYLNMYTTGDYLKLVQNFKDLIVTFIILVFLIFLKIDVKKKIYIFGSLIPLIVIVLGIIYATSSFYFDFSKSLTFLFTLQYIAIPIVILTVFKEQEAKRLQDINDTRIDALLTVSEKVAHDIRSPLSAINLVMSRAKFDDPEFKEIFDGAVKRIDETATKILTQYRTKTGRENEKLEKVNLPEIINEIVKEKKVLNAKVDFETVTNSESGLAFAIKLDMERIISNILDNSIFALKNIIEPKIFISIEDSNDMISLSITDNGTGIPEQIVKLLGNERITTKADTNQGNGIGLLHAKRVIERFNGQFEISSQENVGTTIKISLPKA